MRFVKRIMIGIGVASALAIAAPAAANAATPAVAPAQAATAPIYEAEWGPYFSADHKAEAKGHVYVEKKKFKKWYWDKKVVWVKKCWKHDGEKICKTHKKFKKV